MGTDVRFVVDQFALCNRFASLGVTNPDNTLLPQAYGRVQTAYLKQNRKESFAVQYAEENKSYTLFTSAPGCLLAGESACEQFR